MAECPHVSRLEGVDITKLQEEMKEVSLITGF